MHKTVIIEPPAIEPISLDEAKAHLNYRSSSQDAAISAMITTARRQIERYLNRVLITQEWSVFYDCWKPTMMIPFGSLQQVDAVKYYNGEGSETTLDASQYWVVNSTDPGFIKGKYDTVFPQLQEGRPDAIEIDFTCGFGDEASDVPEEIRHAMKLLVAKYFENREDLVIGTNVARIPGYLTDLIHSYKLYAF